MRTRAATHPTTPRVSRRQSIGRRTHLAAALLAGSALLAACGGGASTDPAADSATQPATAAPHSDERGCVTDYTPGRDYFPDKSTLTKAQNFTITYHDSYQVLEVKQSYNDGPASKYVLYRCGTPEPEATGDLAGAQQIEVPITSIFSASTTHIPLLADLDEVDLLTGVANASFVNNEQARQRIDAQQIVEYSPNRTIDTERVIAAHPDILMTAGVDDPAYQVLQNSGIKVVANAEWLEQTPLGRAEWLKYMAAFTGDEAKAGKVFDQIETDYDAVVRAAAGSGAPVTVLPGQMTQGTWYMPAGDSYVAALLKDANATYAWSDQNQRGGSLQLSLEDVLAKARQAQVWIMGTDVATLADVAAQDARYAEFAAFRDDAVWSNNAKIGAGGGNDYWERGVTRPDLVLADLVKILHPDALPDHQLEFYRQVTR